MLIIFFSLRILLLLFFLYIFLDVVVDGGQGGVGSGLGGLEGGLEGDLGGRNLSSVLKGQSSDGTSQQLQDDRIMVECPRSR